MLGLAGLGLDLMMTHHLLSVIRQFNLSRAPSWGGQFELTVGLMKQCLYKTVGKANLSSQELEEVFLDIQIMLNNLPMNYLEDDIQFPVLTNALAFGEETFNLKEDIDMLEGGLRKKAKYVKKCKDNVWNRWKAEYLKSLRERHNMRYRKENRPALAIGDVVIIKGEERNRTLWRLGIVTELFKGKDKIVRAAKTRCGKSELERKVQHLYPMELHCDWKYNDCIETNEMNEDEQIQKPRRSKRTAAAVAKLKIQDKIKDKQGVPRVE